MRGAVDGMFELYVDNNNNDNDDDDNNDDDEIKTQFWLVEASISRDTTNQKRLPDLGSYRSSVWNFLSRCSDVIWRGNQWWRRQMSAVFPD